MIENFLFKLWLGFTKENKSPFVKELIDGYLEKKMKKTDIKSAKKMNSSLDTLLMLFIRFYKRNQLHKKIAQYRSKFYKIFILNILI